MNEFQIAVPFSILFENVTSIIETSENKNESQMALYKCLKRRIRDGRCLEAQTKLAELLFSLGNYEDAIYEYEQIIQNDPTNISAMLNLSSLFLKTNNCPQLGRIYIQIADYLKSQINTEHLFNCDPHDSERPINKCLVYYSEALKLLPENRDIYLNLASLNRMLDRPKEALGYIQQVMSFDNTDFRVYYEGFLIYEAIGDFHTAKEMIKICLLLNITFLKAYNSLANLMRKEKLYDCAISLFETALLRAPEDVDLLNNYGNTFLEMGNKFKAKEVYLQGYHLDSNSFEINCNLATIYRIEYNYDKAIEHILKAKELEEGNPQVYNILSSIYMSSGLVDLALDSCTHSLKLLRNQSALLQTAICLRLSKRFTESVQISSEILNTNPKHTEAFVNYMQCLVQTNQWTGNDFEANRGNINTILEYHCHTNNTSTVLNTFVAHYLINDLKLKFWLAEANCQLEMQNALFAFDEKKNFTKEKARKKKIKKVAYLIDDIKDSYTFELAKCLTSNTNSKKIEFYFIIFEKGNADQNKFETKNNFNDNKEDSSKIVDLTLEESPRAKYEHLSKMNIDVVIYLDYLCQNSYNSNTSKKIYQTLAMRPANIQIILPSDGCTRDSKMFDYLLTDNSVSSDDLISLYKEKLIIFDHSPYFCYNPYMNESKSLKFRSRDMDPFLVYKNKSLKIMANFSDSCKIDIEIFCVWCDILTYSLNSVLILKCCNEESVVNLKSYAKAKGINSERIIFMQIEGDSKYTSAEYVKYVDLYLDVQTVTGDFEIFFCLFKGIPIVAMRSQFYPITGRITQSIVRDCNVTVASNYEEYIHIALDTLTNQTRKISYSNVNLSPIEKFVNSISDVLTNIQR